MLTVFRVLSPFIVYKSPLSAQLTTICKFSSALSRHHSVQSKVLDIMSPPYAAQNSSEINELVRNLNGSSQKTGGGKHALRCRKHTYDVEGTGQAVDSWQYRDWDYKRRDLPTYARGLFTRRNKDGNHEIAARGYDKFFNVGEVHETEWTDVEVR